MNLGFFSFRGIFELQNVKMVEHAEILVNSFETCINFSPINYEFDFKKWPASFFICKHVDTATGRYVFPNSFSLA